MLAFFKEQETSVANVGQIKYLENDKDLHLYISFNLKKKPAIEKLIAGLPSHEHLLVRISTLTLLGKKGHQDQKLQIICRNIETRAKENIMNFLGGKTRSYDNVETLCAEILNLVTEKLMVKGLTQPFNGTVGSMTTSGTLLSANEHSSCCDRKLSRSPASFFSNRKTRSLSADKTDASLTSSSSSLEFNRITECKSPMHTRNSIFGHGAINKVFSKFKNTTEKQSVVADVKVCRI